MLEILISSSVLILVLAILRIVLRDKISARLQYALWLLVLVRLLVPVSFFHSPVSVAEVAAPVTESARAYSLQTGALPTDALNESVTLRLHRMGVHPEWSEYIDGSSRETQFYSVRQIGHLVWYAGSLVMAVWFLFVNLRLARRLKKNRTPYVCPSVLPVYVTEVVPSPCLFGLVRPSIYLTERAAEDADGARQIVTHELTHYRHGDMIWALLRSVCLVVWWFNPLVWLAAALSRRDCELACDESTIKALGEDARFDYGRTLVGMAAIGASPSDLLCGATTMTTGKKSLKERVARIANAPKMSVIAVILALCVAAVAVGCTFSGKEEKTPAEPETAVEVPASASATDAEGLPAAYSVTIRDPDSGDVLTETPADDGELRELYAVYSALKTLARPLETSDVFSDAEMSYDVRFYDDDTYIGFRMWEDGTFLLFDVKLGGNPTGVGESPIYAEVIEDILDKYHSESAEAVFVSGEPLGGYDRAYWEEVDREFASFLGSDDVELYISEDFDEALPEDDVFGPLTLADYIYGTDSWKFTYDSETMANAPEATILVRDADGRELWIMDDADALMIKEADGSITWVQYAEDPVDCADMIRHLLPWARKEYPSEEAMAAQRAEARQTVVRDTLGTLGRFGLTGLEPLQLDGGIATPFWADYTDPRDPAGPYVTLFYGTDDMSADLRYERIRWNGDENQPLGAESLALCRGFFAETETVTDVKVGAMNGFVTDGSIYAGPRIVWYDADNDLLFSLIAFRFDTGEGYTPAELTALAESVAPQ